MSRFEQLHHIRRRTFRTKFVGHEFHVGRDVLEELAIAFAEVIDGEAAVGVGQETVARTLAVAGEKPLARLALRGELVGFLTRKLLMLRAVDEFEDGVVAQVAEPILRKNEVVAVIDGAVGLDDGAVGAGLAQGANAGHLANPVRQRRVKHLHEKPSDIAPNPEVKNFAEKTPPLLGSHGIRHQFAAAVESGQLGKSFIRRISTFLAPRSSFLVPPSSIFPRSTTGVNCRNWQPISRKNS